LTLKSGSRARKTYHHGDLKNVLLNAALTRIAAHGARALSLRELARATGVSHASTYRHFPNKESLLATIAEQGFRGLTEAMRAAATRCSGDPLAMLLETGVAYVDFGVSHPQHLQVMFGDLIGNRDGYPDLVAASKEAYEVLESSVREVQKAGHGLAHSERIVALAAWAQVHGLALLVASGQIRLESTERIDHRELAVSVISLLRDGLSVGVAPPKRAAPTIRRRGQHRIPSPR
jgi:AcrR family transcriptional regulator